MIDSERIKTVLSTLTKETFIKHKYAFRQGNLIKEIEKSIIGLVMGRTDVPFGVCNSYSQLLIEEQKTRLLHFVVWVTELTQPQFKEYFEIFNSWNFDNHEVTSKRLKEIEKNVKIGESDIDMQVLYTLHRWLPFRFKDYDQQADVLDEYLTHYIKDEKTVIESPFEEQIMQSATRFAKYCKPHVKRFLEDYNRVIPQAKAAQFSPIGPKCYDQKFFVEIFARKKVPTPLFENLCDLNVCLKEAFPGSELDLISLEIDDSPECLERCMLALPKVNIIDTQALKPRIVMQSNDMYDIACNPGMQLVKAICSNFRNSYSTYKPDAEDRYSSIYSVARMASCQAKELLNSGCSNSDLSSATDKLSSVIQDKMFNALISELRKDKEISILMDEKGFTPKYITGFLKLLSESNLFSLIDNEIVIGKTTFGQCQGMRGSFHLLHLMNMIIGYAAFLLKGYPDTFKSFESFMDVTLFNGDDGIVPDTFISEYRQIWQSCSDKECLSFDKSSSEEDLQALQFCKTWIKTNSPSPRIANKIRFANMLDIMNDPELRIAFCREDIYNKRLIQRLQEYASILKYRYEPVYGILSNYSSEFNHTLENSKRLSHAQNFLIYSYMRNIVQSQLCVPIEEASIALNPLLAPTNRARKVVIDNSFVKFDRFINLYELKQLNGVFEIPPSPLLPVYEAFRNIREPYLQASILPLRESFPDIDEEQFDIIISILNYSGCPRVPMGHMKINEYLVEYETINVGYQCHILSTKWEVK